MNLAQLKSRLRARLHGIRQNRKAAKKLRRLIKAVSRVGGVSKRGARFIAGFEGFSPTPTDKLDGYSTVGIGHLIAHRPVTAGDRKAIWVSGQEKAGQLTYDEAIRLLQKDLRETYVPAVRRLFAKGGPLHGEPNQPLFDALVSVAYNLGVGAVQPGTGGFETLGRAIKAGKPGAIAAALPLYVRGPDGPLPGLVRRRKAEARLIRTGNYSTTI